MSKRRLPRAVGPIIAAMLLICAAGCTTAIGSEATAQPTPAPKVDASLATQTGIATAVLAGGCFWGLQWVFEHVPGVLNVTSGYSGGSTSAATYDQVSTGDTGHAETVEITYDPSKVSYGQLLRVYFTAATDPTELNRQGPDTGMQYRGVIFYANPEQHNIAKTYIAQLTAA
ncbi:MAG: peptide-methionine (S)-S-oxide reductase MsrA, partial [Gammaproteobacteria bacterium]